MTPMQFMNALGEYYDKEIPQRKREVYIEKLSRFPHDALEAVLSKVYEQCTYFPKVSQVYSAATDLLISPKGGRKRQGSDECKTCRGTGWEEVTCHEVLTGQPFNAVKRCTCTGLPPLRPHAKFNGWVSEFNGTKVDKAGAQGEGMIPF